MSLRAPLKRGEAIPLYMNFISLFPSLDIFILFLFIIAIILHLIFIKKSSLFINALSVYVAVALVIIVPLFSATVASWLNYSIYIHLVVFLVLCFFVFWLLSHSNLGEFSKNVSPTQFSTSLVWRIAVVGLFFTTVLYFLPSGIIQFGPIVKALFVNFIALIVWFVIPLLLAFAYRFKTRRGWVE